MKRFKAYSLIASPSIWLGLGLGSALGFVFASGFEFSSADGANFVGSLLGSLIAVGGAVSLYYLAERDKVRRGRSHILKLSEHGYRQAENCLSYIDAKQLVELPPSLLVLGLQVDRIKKFFDRFEFDDDKISEAAVCFDNHFSPELKDMSNSGDLANRLDTVRGVCQHTLRCFGTVVSVLKYETSFGPADNFKKPSK